MRERAVEEKSRARLQEQKEERVKERGELREQRGQEKNGEEENPLETATNDTTRGRRKPTTVSCTKNKSYRARDIMVVDERPQHSVRK